ncbi:hypothetical protein A0H81_13669 [Grifola frondosa]|uniref:Uncharacterized protein n=1 Tax=Grifola frondosa TaxID=5627 RepID=A0A1C7LRC0_GRIFR|nr:hypothetical protein A0H81_13669 [Grifola frondosa]
MLSTSPPSFPLFPQTFVQEPKKKDILDYDPASVVDIALQTLQTAGVELLIEWGALLYRRMHVPIIIKNFTYLVPDDDLEGASDILARIGLPLSPPPRFLVRAEGDFQAKGRFHRITRSTVPFCVQHIALFPLSFSCLLPCEMEEMTPSHIISSRCSTILVPRQAAVYTSILRTMLRYPKACATRRILESDLSELICYHLLDLQGGYVDPEDNAAWKELDICGRLGRATPLVHQWSWDGVWGEGEDWMGDALAAVVAGTADIEYLPSNT